MKAFPKTDYVNIDANYREEHESGMDLRDYFAAKALQGLSQSVLHPDASQTLHDMAEDNNHSEIVAKMSYDLADAMMEARK